MQSFSAVVVVHAPLSWWVNEVAQSNMLRIYTTLETFQREMSSLKPSCS